MTRQITINISELTETFDVYSLDAAEKAKIIKAQADALKKADAKITRLRAENEELRAALKPITDIKAFTCIFEWTPVEALRDDEKVHVKLTGAQIKAMRAAAALKETGNE